MQIEQKVWSLTNLFHCGVNISFNFREPIYFNSNLQVSYWRDNLNLQVIVRSIRMQLFLSLLFTDKINL